MYDTTVWFSNIFPWIVELGEVGEVVELLPSLAIRGGFR
jgi:hypothetical protein